MSSARRSGGRVAATAACWSRSARSSRSRGQGSSWAARVFDSARRSAASDDRRWVCVGRPGVPVDDRFRGGCSRCGWVVARGTGRRSRCAGRVSRVPRRCTWCQVPPWAPSTVRAHACETLGVPSGRVPAIVVGGKEGLASVVEEHGRARRRSTLSDGAGGPVEHASFEIGTEVGVHEDAIASGVDAGAGPQPGPLSVGPRSSPRVARMVRIRSARSSQSAWLTARTVTCSAPYRSVSANGGYVCECVAGLGRCRVLVFPALTVADRLAFVDGTGAQADQRVLFTMSGSACYWFGCVLLTARPGQHARRYRQREPSDPPRRGLGTRTPDLTQDPRRTRSCSRCRRRPTRRRARRDPAVSHADCEDLADRIRTIGPPEASSAAPHSRVRDAGPAPRVYTAGDRILVHTNLGGGRDRRVFNGTTGTLCSVGPDGATVLLDQGSETFLTTETIAGTRPDGTPNVSHAWARTVDGAQGGTWHQVHLLGTRALDRHTGYVGQSRGQQPTHTWNTRPETDHPPGLLADQRTPSEVVAAALRRDDRKNLAAHDDPWPLDRDLPRQPDQHAAIAATRPPDLPRRTQTRTLCARTRRTRTPRGHRRAGLPRTRTRPAGPTHPATAWRTRRHRPRRPSHRRAQTRLAHAAAVTRQRHTHVDQGEEAVAQRAAWDQQHQWRSERIAEIDHTLAHHWADITLRAVHADDPLAFGTPTPATLRLPT